MKPGELPEEVGRLIQSSVPTIDALEILLLLAGESAPRTPKELVEAVHPSLIPEPAVRQYLALFKEQGLVKEEAAGFRYQPASPALEVAVRGLAAAYNQRPVTLIRTVYAIADGKKIQSFADAFKLKKDQ